MLPFDSLTTPAAEALATLPGHVISIQSVREAKRDKPHDSHTGCFQGMKLLSYSVYLISTVCACYV